MAHVIKLGALYFGIDGQLTDRQSRAQRFDLGPAFTGESADLGDRYPRLVRLRPRGSAPIATDTDTSALDVFPSEGTIIPAIEHEREEV